MKYDGSVVFSTKLDNSGFINGVKGLPSALGGVKSALTKVGAAVGLAFSVSAIINFEKISIHALRGEGDCKNIQICNAMLVHSAYKTVCFCDSCAFYLT